MNSPALYFHFGIILISLANLLVISLLIVVFALAVTLRLPEKHHFSTIEAGTFSDEVEAGETTDPEVHS